MAQLLFLKYESSGSESLAECGGNSGTVCDCVGCCGVLCSPPIYSAGGRGGFLFLIRTCSELMLAAAACGYCMV